MHVHIFGVEYPLNYVSRENTGLNCFTSQQPYAYVCLKQYVSNLYYGPKRLRNVLLQSKLTF